MNIITDLYSKQIARWPSSGAHIMAQYDTSSIIVYQAYKPFIAQFALKHGHFGGPDFSFSRMSWIKPNFLWMMCRCGWGTKEGQEMVLGLRINRSFFEGILRQAVPSSFSPSLFKSQDEWKLALKKSDVRLQWDPDHDPAGKPLMRRAIQLGLRGRALMEFSQKELIEVIDMTGFVAEQRNRTQDPEYAHLHTPVESIFLPKILG